MAGNEHESVRPDPSGRDSAENHVEAAKSANAQRAPRRLFFSVLREAFVVASVGLIFALAANAISPRGLRLSRNYFPKSPARPSPTVTSTSNAVAIPMSTNAGSITNGAMAPGAVAPVTSAANATVEKLHQRGLQTVTSNQVVELFQDPRFEQGLVVFLDARDDEHYAAGHIPGAWQFDHFRAEKYLPTVLPICLTALKVIIYCNGGECEDSAFAAVVLGDAGVPRELMFIYAGGITEWKAAGRSMETGARGSGQILKPSP